MAQKSKDRRSVEALAALLPAGVVGLSMGLAAAVPAVIFYNRFVNEIGRYVNRLDAFADEFATILSRSIDQNLLSSRCERRQLCLHHVPSVARNRHRERAVHICRGRIFFARERVRRRYRDTG